jgi:hypothetical protein
MPEYSRPSVTFSEEHQNVQVTWIDLVSIFYLHYCH